MEKMCGYMLQRAPKADSNTRLFKTFLHADNAVATNDDNNAAVITIDELFSEKNRQAKNQHTTTGYIGKKYVSLVTTRAFHWTLIWLSADIVWSSGCYKHLNMNSRQLTHSKTRQISLNFSAVISTYFFIRQKYYNFLSDLFSLILFPFDSKIIYVKSFRHVKWSSIYYYMLSLI